MPWYVNFKHNKIIYIQSYEQKIMAKMFKTLIRVLFKLIYGRVNFDSSTNYLTTASEIDKYNSVRLKLFGNLY